MDIMRTTGVTQHELMEMQIMRAGPETCPLKYFMMEFLGMVRISFSGSRTLYMEGEKHYVCTLLETAGGHTEFN